MFATAERPEEGSGTDRDTSELTEAAGVLALAEAARDSVPRLATVLLEAGSSSALLEGRTRGRGRDAEVTRSLRARVTADDVAQWEQVVRDTLRRTPGTRLLAVTDPDYPSNLKTVPSPPLVIFVRGDLAAADARAVAVIGSRQTEDRFLQCAAEVASKLAATGVTVVSGLAAGIDAAAHSGALRAGGRTLAAIATGVDRVYPAEHGPLAAAIAGAGALISRQWPDTPPTRRGFRRRNAVTSGLAVATVVVDAGPTSGARLGARLAFEQHRRVVLLDHLPRRHEWARRLASRAGVVVARDADGVLDAVADLVGPAWPAQLTLF
jgi:DNA processing protein